ncbi:hypothetical protein L596_006408 [Steinernema carpocapsae]|uniref:Uncharacterized protein n=1 Tax=Steinernema carpocapsae TaxID=34508 RepID=A0A4U8V229_STECR|nr:hypothetical protein L596_006408 [Steinernema carpocapsae]
MGQSVKVAHGKRMMILKPTATSNARSKSGNANTTKKRETRTRETTTHVETIVDAVTRFCAVVLSCNVVMRTCSGVESRDLAI